MMLAAALMVLAQTAAPVEQRAQVWAVITSTGRAAEGSRVRWFVEAQPRFDLTNARLSNLFLRAAVGFEVGAGFSIWVGNGYTPSFIPNYRQELRPYLQVLGQHAFGPFQLVNRFRFEERFLDNAKGISLRARHSVRIGYQLGDSRFALAAYDEFFFTLNAITGGPPQGLDQNWTFIGLNCSFGSSVVLEAGYNAVYLFRSPVSQLIHTGVVLLAFNFL